MRTSFLSASLAVSMGVSALPSGLLSAKPLAPALPLSRFAETPKFVVPLTLNEALAGLMNGTELLENALFNFIPGIAKPDWEMRPQQPQNEDAGSNAAADNGQMRTQSTCSNPRIRVEWDSYSNRDRQAFVDGIKCLQRRGPSGQFRQSRSRYEDLVALHQTLTPNVHGNAKFLLWHRYLLFTFEDLLRTECGFQGSIPWFDETRYAGRFAQSSIFSDQWFGGINAGGNCITNGQFANLVLNVGPGEDNTPHCLARNNDDSKTANTGSSMVDACNSRDDYADMAACAEGGAHAWGHNGIGAVMQDVYASPGDPLFFLHHAFIDRNFRIWQNRDPARVNSVDGNGAGGTPLTMDTTINVYGIRPDVRIRDVMDTMSETLCYKYNY